MVLHLRVGVLQGLPQHLRLVRQGHPGRGPGRPVGPAEVPTGCAYAARCPLASTRCTTEEPPLETDAAGRRVACWHAGEAIDLVVPTSRQEVEAS